jgi:hypothetical protein
MDCLDKCDKCSRTECTFRTKEPNGSGPENVQGWHCRCQTVANPCIAHFVARKKAMSKGFQNHHRTCKTVQKWT